MSGKLTSYDITTILPPIKLTLEKNYVTLKLTRIFKISVNFLVGIFSSVFFPRIRLKIKGCVN